jgi:hypothetical protein
VIPEEFREAVQRAVTAGDGFGTADAVVLRLIQAPAMIAARVSPMNRPGGPKRTAALRLRFVLEQVVLEFMIELPKHVTCHDFNMSNSREIAFSRRFSPGLS